MSFVQLFSVNDVYEKGSHYRKWLYRAISSWDIGFWCSNCSKLNPLMLVHFSWNQSKIWEFSMGLYEPLNSPVFTFSRASDLKFCTHSCSCCVYCMMWFKAPRKRPAKRWRHTSPLHTKTICVNNRAFGSRRSRLRGALKGMGATAYLVWLDLSVKIGQQRFGLHEFLHFRVGILPRSKTPESIWWLNSVKVPDNSSPHAPFLALRQTYWTKLSVSIKAKYCVSWLRCEREDEQWKLPLNSSFCTVTVNSKSSWSHGRETQATLQFAYEPLVQLFMRQAIVVFSASPPIL